MNNSSHSVLQLSVDSLAPNDVVIDEVGSKPHRLVFLGVEAEEFVRYRNEAGERGTALRSEWNDHLARGNYSLVLGASGDEPTAPTAERTQQPSD